MTHAKVPDMQNCQCLPLPITSWARKKSDMFHGTKEITLQENLNSKVRDQTTNCKIHCFLLGVNIDGVQKHYHAYVKNVGIFYNNTVDSLLHTKNTLLKWTNNVKG